MSSVYWVLDGTERTWLHRERLKQLGCKWDKVAKSWMISNPDETFKKWAQAMGLVLQFRKDEA